MKRLPLIALLLSASLPAFAQDTGSGPVFVQTSPAPRTQPDVPRVAQAPATSPQQNEHNRVLLCNAEATSKNLKGKEHRAFVSTCLSGDSSIGGSRQPAPGSSAQR